MKDEFKRKAIQVQEESAPSIFDNLIAVALVKAAVGIKYFNLISIESENNSWLTERPKDQGCIESSRAREIKHAPKAKVGKGPIR